VKIQNTCCIKKFLLAVTTGFAISSSAFSDTLGSWVIPSSSGPTTISSSANLAGVNVGPLTTTATGGGVNSAGFGGTAFTTSATVSVSTSKNISFSVSANAGYDVVINGVANFQAYSSQSGPNIWTLYYSASSSFTTSTQIAQLTGTFNTTQTQNMTSAVNSFFATNPISVRSGSTAYFRLVGHQSVSTSGSGRIPSSTVSILGAVAVAPVANMVWNGGASGFWNYDSANLVWLDGSTSISFVPGSIANVNSAASLVVDSAGVNASAFTNNISSGTTTITGGNLTSGSIINVGAGDLALQATNSAGTLENYGTGTLSLSAPGAYTTVNVRNGRIQALTDTSVSGLVNISGGGTLNVGTSSNTISILTVSNGAITGTGILAASGSSFALDLKDETVAASIRGTGGLTKLGSRTLTLSGSNAFSGDVNLNVGTLATSGDDRLPDTAVINLSTNTVFRLGGNEVVKAIAASAASAAMVDLQNYTLTLNVTASNSYTSTIMGNGGSLIKNGSSILTMNETNTFTGGTTLNNGSLRLQASGNRTTNSDSTVTLACSPFGVGTLTLAGGAIYSSSTGSRNIYNNADIRGSFAFGDGTNVSGAITVSTNVTGSYTRLLADSTFTANTDTDWEQPILGSGFNLSKGGGSKLTLRSTNVLNSLSVLAGMLDVRGSNSIGQMNVAGAAALAYAGTSTPFGMGAINLSNGAIFGQSAAIGSTLSDRTIQNPINILGDVLFGVGAFTGSGGYASYLSGNVDLGGANRTLTVANSIYFYGTVTNGGLLVNRLSTDPASTKTLGLYGANSYSGGTTVNGSVDYVNNPILQLGNDSALGTGDLTLTGGGSLIVKAISHPNDISSSSRIITNAISISTGVSGVFDAGTNSVTTLDGSATNILLNNMTLRGAISGGGSLVKTNSGDLTLTGPLSYQGGTTVAEGNLVVVKTNLTATVSSSTIQINFSNNVSAGTYSVLPGALNGTYSPATYNNLSSGQSATFDQSTGQVVVTGSVKTTPAISVNPAATAITYGQTLASSTLIGGSAGGVPGTFAWKVPSTSLPAGTSDQIVTFTPTDTTLYNVVDFNVAVTVNKADASVTWPTAAAITYGNALSAATLSAGSGAGTFAFTSPTTVPNAGPTQSFEVTFTPTDAVNYNYNTLTQNVAVTVNKANASVTWPTAAAITYGSALSAATLSGGSSNGSFAFTSPATVPGAGVAQSFEVTFTPTDAVNYNYNTLTQNVAVTVNKADATVTWPTAAAITAGQSLSFSTFSGGSATGVGGASVTGTFAWTDSTTPRSTTGSYEVTFTPTSGNYNTATTNLSVTVNPAGTTYSGWLNGVTGSNAAFLEYVFGAATAGTLDASLKPTVAITGGNLVLTYYVRQGTLGLTVTAETSGNLSAGEAGWSGITDVPGSLRTVNGVSVQQRTASVPVSGGKKFLRVKAVQN